MFLVVLLVGTVSALDFTNTKSYDEKTKIVTIKSFPLIGRDISTTQLDTPLDFKVGAGYQKVYQYTIDLFDDTYTDAIGEVVLIDLNTGKEIQRELDYKYLVMEWVDVKDDRTKVCRNFNGTEYCEWLVLGTHKELGEVWRDLDKSILTKGKVTVGIFTTVKVGDKVEWIPTLFGKEIDEWATWNHDWDTNLIAVYKFEETSGNVIDSLGTYSATNNGITQGVEGFIGNAGNFSGTSYADVNLVSTTQDYTFTFWGKLDPTAEADKIWFDIQTGRFLLYSNRSGNFGYFDGGSDLGFPFVQHKWTHYAFTFDSGTANASLYFNGVLMFSNLEYAGENMGGTVTIGLDYAHGSDGVKGTLDELYIWERVLTPAEILLVNNSDGYSVLDSFPTVTLSTPIDTDNFTVSTILFGGVVVDDFIIDNVSLIIDDVYIETNTSGVNNSNYTFTKSLVAGDYTYNYEACDNSSQCTNGTARSFTRFLFIEEGIFYNSSTHETATETFTINVTTNGTQTTSAEFFHGGVSQGASTKTGTNANANFSNTIQIPITNGTREFYWKVTIGSNEGDSTKTNQTVNETVWTYCNSSYTTPFLNVSFKDESDDSYLNATIPTSNFIYYLGDGTVTKTYTYVNNTENYYYQFCVTPNLTIHTDPYIQFKQGASYPQRIYDAEVIDYTNDTTDLTLYLLGTADGIYVTFQVINTANLVLSGVEITAIREISGSDVQVGIGTTGADGGVTLWLNPDFSHDFTFTKSGFPTLEESFAPTQSAYTITLGGGTTSEISYFRGIIRSVLPTDSSLTNDTAYTFGFNLTSTFWSLTEYGFNLRLVNGTIITGDTTTTSGTPLTKSFNTLNQSKIYLDYYWLVNSTYTNGTKLWLVYNTLNTQWSIDTFFKDFNTYMNSGFFGIDDFGRYLIIFIVIFFSVGIMSYKFGFTDPVYISVMTFLIVFFFEVVVKIIPPLAVISGTEVNYLLTYLTGLIATIVVLREVTRV